MAYISQGRHKFSGTWYENGEVVPDSVATGHVRRLGLVSSIPDELVGSILSGWDPSDHTVEEVKDFVGKHPTQLERVLADEEVGEQRVTLIEWLEARAAEDDSGGEDRGGGASPDDGGGGPGVDGAGDGGTPPASVSSYDPAAYNVAEVLAYAEANRDAIEPIRAAEVAGKNRTTLIDGLDELAETAPGDSTDGR